MDISPRDSDQFAPTIHRDASWGALISIVVILAMIIVGAFYAWGKRIAEDRGLSAAAAQALSATTTTSTTTSK